MDLSHTYSNSRFDALAFNNDTAGLLMSSSSLNVRYWTGAVHYYSQPEDAPGKQQAAAEIPAGVTDVAWTSTQRLLATTDAGALSVWDLSDDQLNLTCSAEAVEHDDLVFSLSVNCSREKAVTGGFDRRVVVWDLIECSSFGSYVGHSALIWSVAFSATEPEVFASCSQDNTVVLWDLRKPKPAKRLPLPESFIAPCSLAWSQVDSDRLVVGMETGQLFTFDLRADTERPLHAWTPHSRAVHRLAFCPDKPNLLATASDDCTVAVSSIESEVDEFYQSAQHNDFVRGLAWRGDTLYSCGWDSRVYNHQIGQNGTMELTDANNES